MVKKCYSLIVGLKKTFKNVLVTAAVPAVAYALLNAAEWLPREYNVVLGFLVACGSYLTKNYIENR